MVEHQPSKLDTWVRFPSPAFFMRGGNEPCIKKREQILVLARKNLFPLLDIGRSPCTFLY